MDWRVFLLSWIGFTFACVGAPEDKAAAELVQAREQVSQHSQSSAAHLRLAIAIGKMTDFTDNRTKMDYARQIRSEAEIALQLDPKNAEACRILGKWHEGMARLNPVLRAIATTLYGKMPDASDAEAGRYFRLAVQLAPENLPAHAELARWLQRNGSQNEMQLEWKRVLTLPPRDAEDRAFQEEARAALR